jgi:hypothetical protein
MLYVFFLKKYAIFTTHNKRINICIACESGYVPNCRHHGSNDFTYLQTNTITVEIYLEALGTYHIPLSNYAVKMKAAAEV